MEDFLGIVYKIIKAILILLGIYFIYTLNNIVGFVSLIIFTILYLISHDKNK